MTIDAPEVLTKSDGRLTELKQGIRQSLAASWSAAAAAVPGRLLAQESREAALAKAVAAVAESLRVVAEMERAAKAKAMEARLVISGKKGGSAAAAELPVPWARWGFAVDAEDSQGRLPGTLEGGAKIANGRLILNGSTAFLKTGPLPETVVAKTFEAWVILKDLDQSGGGVISLEKEDGGGFDSLVYAEKQPRRWMAGSEAWVRTRPVPGALETGASEQVVHVACVYDDKGKIQLFREGVACGEPYQSTGPVTWPAGASHVLLGLRHTGGYKAFLSGEIEEARLYNSALSAQEIHASWKAGPEALATSEWLAVMTPEERQRFDQAKADHTVAEQQLKQLRGADEVAAAWDKALGAAASDSSSPLRFWRMNPRDLPEKTKQSSAPDSKQETAGGERWLDPWTRPPGGVSGRMFPWQKRVDFASTRIRLPGS